jgi:hypothetical protein
VFDPDEAEDILTSVDQYFERGESDECSSQDSAAIAMGRAIQLQRLEKDEEREGDRLMAFYGFEVVRFSQARATMQTEGIPDRRYYHRERKLALWWEAKSASGKQRKAQRAFQEMCEAVGEVYVLGTVHALAMWLARYIVTQTEPLYFSNSFHDAATD